MHEEGFEPADENCTYDRTFQFCVIINPNVITIKSHNLVFIPF